MKLETLRPKIRRFLPFLVIFLAVVIFLEREKSPLLPPPHMDLISLDVRATSERNFTLPDLSGNPIRLSDLKGKVLLLNFFATWCAPCRDEMPSLEALFQANQNKDFLILGISRDVEGKKAVAPFMKEYGLTFPVVLDPEMRAFQLYFIRAIPVTYLLDRQGRIAGMHTGVADWNSSEAQALIDQLLQES